MNKKSFISVEGTIGVGKSTLAKALSDYINAEFCPESFDPSLLDELYKGNHSKTFTLEIMFLTDRYRQLKQMEVSDSKVVVADYNLEKSLLFITQTLTKFEQEAFKRVYNDLNSMVVKPTGTIILESPVEELIDNIKLRGRDFEKNIDQQYLQDLNDKYDEMFYKLTANGEPVIKIPGKMVKYDRETKEVINIEEIYELLVANNFFK